ncbi:MAG: EthD domain-containing protein [Streptosporangiaceae bacterium]|nr:EthD domain-containing protein [Streptosporangiaceae bacterium]
MIHQIILAAPKPGMTAEQFQDYWVRTHAVQYASKIPQIRKYLVDTRIPSEFDMGIPRLPHEGIAEIWLANDEEQLASLQTPEFLEGARRDEPNWAAFWLTIVLDTTAHEIVSGPESGLGPKVVFLLKRHPGLKLAEYRQRTLDDYAPDVAKLPGLRRYVHGHTRDGFYVFGEAAFDSVEQLWFDDEAALREALSSPHWRDQVTATRAALVDPAYVFSLTVAEHWIIGPQPR